jgi:EmrB/QacA subfamily drug resistance transporter
VPVKNPFGSPDKRYVNLTQIERFLIRPAIFSRYGLINMKTIESEKPALTGRVNSNLPDKWLVFVLVAAGVFMSTLDSSIVNIALPAIMADFQAPLTVIEWVPMIYLLTVSSLLLTCGRLSDIRGRRQIYCSGFVVFSIGSLCCAITSGAPLLIASRALQGIGAAMLMACSPAMVVDVFPVAERGRAMGMVGMVVATGLTTGPALGGVILEHFSWRIIFFINIPIGIGVTVAALRILKRMPQKLLDEPLDWIGGLLIAVCFSTFIVGLSRFHDWRPASIPFIVTVLLFVAGTVLLIRVESLSAYPIIDPALFKIRLFVLPVAAAIILFMGLFFITFLMPFYMVHPLGFSMNRVGGTMMIPFVFLFIVAPISGALSDRIGSRDLCTIGMALLAGALWLLSRLTAGATVMDMAWRLALTGIGIAVFISPNSAAAMSAVPAKHRGIASGSVATARNLGMVIGVAAAGLIFNSTFRSLNGGRDLQVYTPALEFAFMAAFHRAMLTGAALASGGAVIAYLRGKDSPTRTKNGKYCGGKQS